MSSLDVLFINPNSLNKLYQKLADTVASIEPPLWSLLLAEGCRTKGYAVDILDCCAEQLNDEQSVDRIKHLNPRLICFTVGGPSSSSSVSNMSGTIKLIDNIKNSGINIPVIVTGKYVNALPKKTLQDYSNIDFVTINEGLYCLLDLLETNFKDKLYNVRALGYRIDKNVCINDIHDSIVPQNKLDEDLPGYAWDLLPYNKKPFDLYQTQIWHSNYDFDNRSPFSTIYTSLGCAHRCSFCTVNIINRTNYITHKTSSDCARVRKWSKEKVLSWFDELAELGVQHIRISDDMFLDHFGHSLPILEDLSKKSYVQDLNLWAYSRVNGFTDKSLELCKKSSVNWLAPGIESSSNKIRNSVNKGKYHDVRQAIELSKKHNVNVMANYIFGLPDDNLESMEQTKQLMLELCTESANCCPCMALPGSQLYFDAIKNNIELPKTFSGYAYLSEDCTPMPTKHCTNKEVLQFRDDAWLAYMEYKPYLNYVESKFGIGAVNSIKELCKTKLKRNILL